MFFFNITVLGDLSYCSRIFVGLQSGPLPVLYGVKCSKNGLKLVTFGAHLVDMCQGLNSHYFHIIGDGHQPNSRGLYTHCKDSY